MASNDHMTAAEVKELRARIGYTQERLARAVGVKVSTVQNWEQDRGWPNQENAKRLQLLDAPQQQRRDELRDAIETAIESARRIAEVIRREDSDDITEQEYYAAVIGHLLKAFHAN